MKRRQDDAADGTLHDAGADGKALCAKFRVVHQLDVRLARGSAEGVAGLAGRPDALYQVKMPDGAVLCVVEPGPAFAELAPHLKLPPAGLSPHQLIRP